MSVLSVIFRILLLLQQSKMHNHKMFIFNNEPLFAISYNSSNLGVVHHPAGPFSALDSIYSC